MKATKVSFIILITILNPCFFIEFVLADTASDVKTNANNIAANKKAISDNVRLTDRNRNDIRDNRNGIIRDMNDIRTQQITTKKIVDASKLAITALQAGHTALENQIQNNKSIAINAEKMQNQPLTSFLL